jgi:hypothetical protein
VYGEQKKEKDCEHKMLKSDFATLRNFLAPLQVDTQSSVLLAQCCWFCCKKRWIAIVEQPD